jgi:hypothetical protein
VVAVTIARRRRTPAAAITLAVGLGLALVAAMTVRLPGPPLYDGVPVIEPYRWVDPPPGEAGNPTSASARFEVKAGSNPLVVLATTEVPPQAQMFAVPGGLTVPPGITALLTAIKPLAAESQPTDGQIDGNVYRITVTTQSGAPVNAPASAGVTVVLRAPDPTATDDTLARLVDGTWQPLKTDVEAGAFSAVVTDFGDFALIAPGSNESAANSAAPAESTAAGPTPLTSATGGAGEPGTGRPNVTVVAGIAILLVLAGLAVTAILPGRRRAANDRGWSGREPPRRRR